MSGFGFIEYADYTNDLAVVISATPDFFERMPGLRMYWTAMTCYCEKHNIPLYYDPMVLFDHMDSLM